MKLVVPKIFSRNPLFFAFLFPAIVDTVVTVLGQDRTYWSDFALARDASPAYYFLIWSPLLFFLGSVVWFIFWYWVFLKINQFWRYFLVILFISSHAWGSSTWIIKMLKNASWYQAGNQLSSMFIWLVLIIYFISIALIASKVLDYERKLKK